MMWHSLEEWSQLTDDWKKTNFKEIDAPSIAKLAEKYAKTCKRLEGALDPNPIQAKLKFLVEQFEAAMPIVTALRNPDLTSVHKDEINELVGQEIKTEEEGFTLQSLLDMNVVSFMDQIVAKSVQATGEAKLKTALAELTEAWEEQRFTCKVYKERDNVFILIEIDDLYQFLDEGIAQINMILGNRFVKVMRAKAEVMKKQLNTLQEAVSLWVEC